MNQVQNLFFTLVSQTKNHSTPVFLNFHCKFKDIENIRILESLNGRITCFSIQKLHQSKFYIIL